MKDCVFDCVVWGLNVSDKFLLVLFTELTWPQMTIIQPRITFNTWAALKVHVFEYPLQNGTADAVSSLALCKCFWANA